MKEFKFTTFLIIAILIPFLQSCLDDNESRDSIVISTIKVPNKESKEFYFSLDNGRKIYPGDISGVKEYKAEEGQRAFVIFKELKDQKIEGYDYNVQVKRIENILTKDTVALTKENAEEIGDDPINITYMWLAQGYLTIEFQYLGTHSQDKKHFLNLVVNQIPKETETDNEYIELEFRHNKKEDTPTRLGEGYVSFKLGAINEELKKKKGLKIRVNTLYDNVQYQTVKSPYTNQ